MMNNLHNSVEYKDFKPKQVVNKGLKDFFNHKIGMFISYGMSSFTDTNNYLDNWELDPPPPSQFTAPSVIDSAQWATEAANLGCEYAVLTLRHHIGFNNFPYTAPYNHNVSENTYDTNRGVLEVPVYKRYDVSVTDADQNIVGKFLDQCVVEGIKSCLYYNIGKNINMRRGLNLIDAAYDQTETYSQTYENYVDWCVKELEYISKTFEFDYIWLDAPHHAPRYVNNVRTQRAYMQDFYNAIKKYKPNAVVISNTDMAVIGGNRLLLPDGTDSSRPPYTWDGSEMIMFPVDVSSFEYFRVPTNSDELEPETTHKGIGYYMPKEVISTILVGQYFGNNDNFGTMETAVALQAKYDYCRANNVPFLLNVAVARNGVIPSAQLTRFGEIIL